MKTMLRAHIASCKWNFSNTLKSSGIGVVGWCDLLITPSLCHLFINTLHYTIIILTSFRYQSYSLHHVYSVLTPNFPFQYSTLHFHTHSVIYKISPLIFISRLHSTDFMHYDTVPTYLTNRNQWSWVSTPPDCLHTPWASVLRLGQPQVTWYKPGGVPLQDSGGRGRLHFILWTLWTTYIPHLYILHNKSRLD